MDWRWKQRFKSYVMMVPTPVHVLLIFHTITMEKSTRPSLRTRKSASNAERDRSLDDQLLEPRASSFRRFEQRFGSQVMSPARTRPTVAFLGPLGTYSHQVSIAQYRPGHAGPDLPQTAFERFGTCADYAPCDTISSASIRSSSRVRMLSVKLMTLTHAAPTEVYHYSASDRDQETFHVLPFENSKNGIVLETLNLLLQTPGASSSRIPGDFVVLEELRVSVSHCLVVSEGCEGLEAIECVRSHEQVCFPFLRCHKTMLTDVRRHRP